MRPFIQQLPSSNCCSQTLTTIVLLFHAKDIQSFKFSLKRRFLNLLTSLFPFFTVPYVWRYAYSECIKKKRPWKQKKKKSEYFTDAFVFTGWADSVILILFVIFPHFFFSSDEWQTLLSCHGFYRTFMCAQHIHKIKLNA